jgi:hypothetical protein
MIRPKLVRGNDLFEVQMMPHSPDSPDVVITDYYLLGSLKQTLQDIDGSDDEELKSETLTMFQGIPSDDLKESFDHWIERCQWVPTNRGNYYLS